MPHSMIEINGLAKKYSDRVAIMDEGRILALDTMKSLIGLMGGGVIHVGRPWKILPVSRGSAKVLRPQCWI